MKKLMWILLPFLLGTPVWAQTKSSTEIKSLLGQNTRYGYYGALQANYSKVAKQDALSLGGRVGIILDESLGLGIGGTMVTNSVNNSGFLYTDKLSRMDATYGGVYIEPMLGTKSLVHVSFPMLIGGGSAHHFYSQNDNFAPDARISILDSDNYLVAEPGFNLEVNLTSFMAVGIGATYRYTVGFSISGVSNHALDGITGGMTVKIEKF
jgi:hypothetical protein